MSDAPGQPPELELRTLLLATDWSEGAGRLHAHAAAITRLFKAEVAVGRRSTRPARCA